ncbi:MAG: ABC transporter ATP-binding protein [Planctomycetota bacterium]
MTSLSATDVGFAYRGDEPVIERFSLEFHPGQLVVLLGGNGAGKTTLLQLLAGQLHAQSGSILVDGQPIKSWSRTELATRLTLMPQFEPNDTSFSVEEMVQLGRSVHRGWFLPFTSDDTRAVDRAMELTGIQELRDRSIKSLSGGQWRRAVLARSLAQESPILLLDEPTSGLDLRHQFECLGQLRSLVHDNQLIAIVTLHNLNFAAMFADRIAVLANRRLRAVGLPEEVITEGIIQDAFGIQVSVVHHILPGKPFVVPAAEMIG